MKHPARTSALLALGGAVALVVMMAAVQLGGPVDLAAPSPLLTAALALQAVMVPTVIIGVGLGGLALIREGEEADRLALVGVIGGGTYLFTLSLLMLFLVSL